MQPSRFLHQFLRLSTLLVSLCWHHTVIAQVTAPAQATPATQSQQSALAQTKQLPWVQKHRFVLHQFKTQQGAVIEQVQIGWEAYGQLNADKSNVILITHHFSGSSHAAGRYQASDAAPGYWDSIIGPGKAIDTNRFYVISSDTLVNLNAFDPTVITTGPASINPATGKPYGLDFPLVTIADFVEVQKALLDSLGIRQLYAVAGPSMGSFQALEWASRYPERVQRVIPAIGTAFIDSYTALKLQRWAEPILLDPNWQQGNYYQSKTPPRQGLTYALAAVTLDAMHPLAMAKQFTAPAQDSPAQQDIRTPLLAQQQLLALAQKRSKLMDANHLLYLVRASQLWRVGLGDDWQQAIRRIKAPVLWLPARNDLLLTPAMATTSQQALQRSSNNQLALIDGESGHLDGLRHIDSLQPLIRQFLAQPVN